MKTTTVILVCHFQFDLIMSYSVIRGNFFWKIWLFCEIPLNKKVFFSKVLNEKALTQNEVSN
jgi:hypothetical protein